MEVKGIIAQEKTGQDHHRIPSIIPVDGLMVRCRPGKQLPGHKPRETGEVAWWQKEAYVPLSF